ncbi:hypothetical protein RRG08_008056 [Elysia crispata]|uniref:Uncharacterized protein n=1 Tax=Elysia crispata TaxID=231223 RepID=A0AAE1D6L8_9GAST|nr:hypothetical protein RRG08_008056 [Elysia crispata]
MQVASDKWRGGIGAAKAIQTKDRTRSFCPQGIESIPLVDSLRVIDVNKRLLAASLTARYALVEGCPGHIAGAPNRAVTISMSSRVSRVQHTTESKHIREVYLQPTAAQRSFHFVVRGRSAEGDTGSFDVFISGVCL